MIGRARGQGGGRRGLRRLFGRWSLGACRCRRRRRRRGTRAREEPFEEREIYKARSPFYQVDRIRVPILVHVATNDTDVNFEEAEMLIHKLRSVKPELAETKIYVDPPGGHGFSRRVNPRTLEPEHTPEQRDSWNRVWAFLEWNLRPYEDPSKPPPSGR